MTKYEWEEELLYNLKLLPDDERKKVLEYYNELFEDKIEMGFSEAQIIGQFGNPRDIARKVIAEYELENSQKSAPQPQREEPQPNIFEEAEPKETVSFEQFGDGIRCVEIEIQGGRISLVKGAAFEVRCSGNESFRYTSEQAGDRLIVKGKYTKAIYRWFSWLSPTFGVEIVLPDIAVDLKVNAPNSHLEIRGLCFNDADMRIQNGGLVMLDTKAANCVFRGSNGGVKLAGGEFNQLLLHTSNGGFTVSDVTATGKLTLETSNGGIFAQRCAAETICLLSTNGSIRVDDVSGENIELRTANSGIFGTVRGEQREYTVTTETSNGKASPQNQRGTTGKRLYARTSNGKIDLKFTDSIF